MRGIFEAAIALYLPVVSRTRVMPFVFVILGESLRSFLPIVTIYVIARNIGVFVSVSLKPGIYNALIPRGSWPPSLYYS